MTPDDPRLAGLPEEDLATINFSEGVESTTVDPALSREAAGYSGDAATAQYIRDLQAGVNVGAGTVEQRTAALNVLIQQGKDRNLAERGSVTAFPGAVSGDDDDDDDNNTPAFSEDKEDAFAKLKSLLNELGLSNLTGNVRDLIAKGILDGDAILFNLKDTSEFQARFSANAARKLKGLPELKPLTYVALENQYRETLRANGLDPTLYDKTTDFQALIEGDVSNAELQRRINYGYRMVAEADPEVLRQMEELYKVTPAQLAQYFLDPSKTAPVLEKQAAAAAIAARGQEQAKTQLSKLTAEELVDRGYTESQALAAFKILGEQQGLYDEMSGETALTQGEKVGSVFGYDVESQQKIARRKGTRKAPFEGGGSYTRTSGVTSGTIESGLAQAN